MELDSDLMIACRNHRSMSGEFLMIDDIPPDYRTAMMSQCKMNIMEVTNNAL